MTMSKKEFMESIKAGLLDESFTHIAEDGTETTYNVTVMRRTAQEQNRPVHTMVLPHDFSQTIRRLRDVDNARVLEEDLDVEDPAMILFFPQEGNTPQSYILLDGVHRVLRRIEVKGMTSMRAWVFLPHEVVKIGPRQVVLKDTWGQEGFLDQGPR